MAKSQAGKLEHLCWVSLQALPIVCIILMSRTNLKRVSAAILPSVIITKEIETESAEP